MFEQNIIPSSDSSEYLVYYGWVTAVYTFTRALATLYICLLVVLYADVLPELCESILKNDPFVESEGHRRCVLYIL